jgi:hypothetical protein
MKTLSIRAALQLGGATSILNHLVGKFTIDGTLSLRKVVESVQSALERFFLDEVASKDLFFRGAHRLSCAVEPLIDRAHALEAMERSILEAQSTVFIAGWLFLPETPLLDPDVRKIIGKEFDLLKGIKVSWPLTWLSLIRFVLEKKGVAVKVRIIITDFDPFFLAGKHRLCWSAMKDLAEMQDKLPSDRRENLEFIGSMHGFFLNLTLVKKGGAFLPDG